MSIAYKQTAGAPYTFRTSPMTASFETTPAEDDSVFVVVVYRGTPITVTDNQSGNTYTQYQDALFAAASLGLTIFWCPAIAAPSGTFTVTIEADSPCTAAIIAVSGLDSADQGNAAFENASLSSYSITASAQNASANDFVLAAIVPNSFSSGSLGLATPSSDYTEIYNSDSDGNGTPLEVAYKIVSAAETSSAAWTWTPSTFGVIAAIGTFKAASSGVTVNAAVATLALTEETASLSLSRTLDAGTDSLTLAEFAASLGLGLSVSAGHGALTLAEQAATLDLARTVAAAADTLTLAEQAASIALALDIAATAEALLLAEHAAAVMVGSTLGAGSDTLTLTEQTASIEADRDISAGHDSLTLAEQLAVILLGKSVATPHRRVISIESARRVIVASRANRIIH